MSSVCLTSLQAGINPIYNAFGLSKNNICYYSCSNSIIVSDLTKIKNEFSLNKHKERVNFVKLVSNFTQK